MGLYEIKEGVNVENEVTIERTEPLGHFGILRSEKEGRSQ